MSTNSAQSALSTKVETDPVRMPNDDNRKYRRFDVDINGYVTLVPHVNPDDHAWELFRSEADRIQITNLSAAGLHFVSTVEFTTEDVVWVSLLFDTRLTTVRARVVHCRPVDEEVAADGEFGVIGKDKEVAEFGENFATGVQFVKSGFAQKAIAEIMSYLTSIGGAPLKRKDKSEAASPRSTNTDEIDESLL